ncbi:hypothetical protein BJV82DRAFT_616529 [Fennellomyces sp. T-0311]|nr:hypothetical protein BJV82DRAFT_616529 [Fennellomyces sp. T-0311]
MSQPVEAIERTPEYDQFMRQLREFHERKGTPFQPEPILGGKKLDLLRIYRTVMDAGGYEKVTQNRGWKQVGDPFDFPPTCTNSAYILKAVYIKNLLGWEEENYWKRPWNPPKEQLEQRTGHKTASPMPVASAIKPRDTARQTATAFNYQAQNPNMPAMRPPAGFMPQFAPMQNQVFFPAPIYVDEEFRSRLLMALRSRLPNEEDWAFNTLVKISFNFDALTLDYMPMLLDILVAFAEPFYKQHVEPALERKSEISESMFSSKKNQEMLERVLQVFHILRNFSFLETNVRRIAHHDRLRQMLMMGIALPPDSQYAELSRHCLDILENIAPQVIVNGPADPYILTMIFLLFTNDRALILGAIRSLTRVGVTEINERVLGTGNPDTIKRMSQLLYLDDEEMTAATLEYFYQCSSLNGNFSSVLVKSYPGNLIGLLTGYLSYKSVLAPKSSSLNATIHGIPQTQAGTGGKNKSQAPTIPDLTDYAHLDEPYRCLGWLKEKLVKAGLDDKMELKDIFAQYKELFGTEKPLGLKEFYTVLKIAFPQPPPVEAAVASGQMDDLVLQNVKYAPSKSAEELKCKWAECSQQFETEEDLHKHITEAHLQHKEEAMEEDGKENEPGYKCQWLACNRSGFKDKAAAVHHLRTHFGKVAKRSKKRPDFMIDKIPVDDSEVSGVPLTAALLLRNLAKEKQHHGFFMPYQNELASLAIQRPKLARYILTVLSELRTS